MPETNVHHLPTTFAERPASQALDRLQFYQTFVRRWAGALTAAEFTVMAQIVDRTVGWGLTTIEITTTRLLKGDNLYQGMGVSRAQMFRVLTALEEKGCIVRKTTTSRIVITINTRWEPEMIAIPKRLKGLQPVATEDDEWSHGETTRSHGETAPVSQCDTLNTIPLTEPSKDNAVPSVRGEDAVLVARMKNLSARSAKVAKPDAAAETIWRAALVEHFPQTPHSHWSVKDKGRIKQMRSKWRDVGAVAFNDFLRWAVGQWHQIIAVEFHWMTENEPPAVPSIGFMLSFWGRFVDVLAEHKLEAWLTAADRTELERKMARGLTREEALREMGAADAASALRKELREREAKLELRARAARQSEQRAERLTQYGEAAPVHPRSRIAQEQRNALRPASAAPKPGPAPSGPLAAPKVSFDD